MNAVVSGKVDVAEVSDFLFVKEVVGLVRGFVVGGKVSGRVDVPEVSDFLFVKGVVGLVRGSVAGGKDSGKVDVLEVSDFLFEKGVVGPGFCCRKDADFNCQTDVCYARNVPIVTGTNSEIMNFLRQVGHHGNYTSFGINKERVIFG